MTDEPTDETGNDPTPESTFAMPNHEGVGKPEARPTEGLDREGRRSRGTSEATSSRSVPSGVRRRTSGTRDAAGMSELGRLSGQRRRERKQQREREAALANLTARQRLGLGLSKLTQEQLDAVVQRLATDAAAGDTKAVHAFVRLLDQSFGRAGQEEPADPRSTDEKPWEEWTEAERASYRQALLAQREREDAERQAAGDSSDPRDPPTS
jgi:hypothetical protein